MRVSFRERDMRFLLFSVLLIVSVSSLWADSHSIIKTKVSVIEEAKFVKCYEIQRQEGFASSFIINILGRRREVRADLSEIRSWANTIIYGCLPRLEEITPQTEKLSDMTTTRISESPAENFAQSEVSFLLAFTLKKRAFSSVIRGKKKEKIRCEVYFVEAGKQTSLTCSEYFN